MYVYIILTNFIYNLDSTRLLKFVVCIQDTWTECLVILSPPVIYTYLHPDCENSLIVSSSLVQNIPYVKYIYWKNPETSSINNRGRGDSHFIMKGMYQCSSQKFAM